MLPNGQKQWVSWHLTVDDTYVIKHLPFNEIAWHAGPGNAASIGIEICMNSDGDQAVANKKAAALIAQLLKELKLEIGAVRTHQSWTGKYCPTLLIGQWAAFLAMIKAARDAIDPKLDDFIISQDERNEMKDLEPSDEDLRPEIDHDEVARVVSSELRTQSAELGAYSTALETFNALINKAAGVHEHARPRLFPKGIDYIEFSLKAPTELKFIIAGPKSRPSTSSSPEVPHQAHEDHLSGEADGDDSPSGYLDPEGDTVPEENWFDALSAPPVNAQLVMPKTGLWTYGSASKRWGIQRTIQALTAVGQSFATKHPGVSIGIGDVSKQGGGHIPGHKSHRLGVDVDVLPLRSDHAKQGVTWKDAAYSRVLTQDLVHHFLTNSVFPVRLIFFNDSKVKGVQPWPNHDNHLHVRFNLDVV